MGQRTTIRTVAVAAGVSASTVSNVLNGRRHEMSAETLDRVQSAMARLNYRPNRVAQGLATNSTRTVALIVSELTNTLYPPVLLGAETVCREAEFALLIANAPDLAAERRTIEVLLDKRVSGIVLFSSSAIGVDDDHLLRAVDAGTPVVAINRHGPATARLTRVQFDHLGGARAAVRHLIELGHLRIGHIAGPASRFTGRLRRDGYAAALREASIPVAEHLIVEGDYSFETGRRAFAQVWAERPTAVFVGGDVMALGALRAARDLGVCVPADLSLVAFGDPDAVRFATPGVTTVDLPVAEAGRLATELVLHRVADSNGRGPAEAPLLKPTLVVRETTASPPSRG
jgi:LacI family transcriptional regulator